MLSVLQAYKSTLEDVFYIKHKSVPLRTNLKANQWISKYLRGRGIERITTGTYPAGKG
jgi:hypothetical protein